MDYVNNNFNLEIPDLIDIFDQLCVASKSKLFFILFGASNVYYNRIFGMCSASRIIEYGHHFQQCDAQLGNCPWCNQLYNSIQENDNQHVDNGYIDAGI